MPRNSNGGPLIPNNAIPLRPRPTPGMSASMPTPHDSPPNEEGGPMMYVTTTELEIPILVQNPAPSVAYVPYSGRLEPYTPTPPVAPINAQADPESPTAAVRYCSLVGSFTSGPVSGGSVIGIRWAPLQTSNRSLRSLDVGEWLRPTRASIAFFSQSSPLRRGAPPAGSLRPHFGTSTSTSFVQSIRS